MKVDLAKEDWILVMMHLQNYADMVKHSEPSTEMTKRLEGSSRELANRIAEQIEDEADNQ